MKPKQHLVITLPEALADLPIRLRRGAHCEEMLLDLLPSDAETEVIRIDPAQRKYAFIWHREDYVKVALDEIQWIEADKSYSIIHLTGQRDLTVSFNLAVVRRALPPAEFVQIHRSFVVNLSHIKGLIGNCVKIGIVRLTIGKEYRNAFLDRFIFLGIRRSRCRT